VEDYKNQMEHLSLVLNFQIQLLEPMIFIIILVLLVLELLIQEQLLMLQVVMLLLLEEI